MRILAFDPASSCGWCVLDDGAYVDGGTEVFSYPTAKQEREGVPRGRKWDDARRWISETITHTHPDAVFCEDVLRHTGTLAAHAYGYLRLSIEADCCRSKVPFYSVGVGVWKKTIGVSGNADKQIVLDEVQRRFAGVEFLTHDHSDATGIALAGHQLLTQGRLDELQPKAKSKKTR